MKIVFIVDHYTSVSDGTIITARRFEEELIKQGHSVRVISCRAEGENKIALREKYVPIVTEVARKQNVHFAKFDKKIVAKAMQGADVVHLLLPFKLEKQALKLAKKLNITVTAAFHLHPGNILRNAGLKKEHKLLNKFIFWLWRKNIYDKVDHIHCPSQFTADELMKHNYKAKLHVISNGVSDSFVPSENKVAKSDKFEILMVGRLASEKRQDLLIKAVEMSKYKDIMNITFAGRGPLKEKYVKMSESLPNNASFEFLNQEELLKKIHASDIYVHAADVEIEGISCIEAFACGLVPVIGNAEKSATKQFVIDSRCGFEAGNPESLKNAIEYWIENPKELAEMKQKYIEYGKIFKLEYSVKQFVKMFKQAVASDPNTGLDKAQNTEFQFENVLL